MNARLAAVKTLLKVQQGQSLQTALATTPVKTQDEALHKALCKAICRWFYTLEPILNSFLTKPLKTKDRDIQLLLMLGLYQLHWLDIPHYAVIQATAEITKQLKKKWATGLVNAVLRKAQHASNLKTQATDNPTTPAFPVWFAEAVKTHWPDAYQQIRTSHLTTAPMVLRVNQQQTSTHHYQTRLREKGIDSHRGHLSNDALYLTQTHKVTSLPHFLQGACSVQDEAAQLAAYLLNAQPGEILLDACAAPGGKSCHILERCPAIGALIMTDKAPDRLMKIEENLQRLQLGADRHKIIEADATQAHPSLQPARFDRILLDAPCSATGITRRHPDILWLRRPEDIPSLVAHQARLLQQLWTYLKPGGQMLYATCSILPAENEQQIANFLAHTPDAQPQTLDIIPTLNANPQKVSTRIGWQLLPSAAGHDGFYYAALNKIR